MEQITFQNISCYCLTFGTEDRMENIIISKHLMLLFNEISPAVSNSFNSISKHLMLLFNQVTNKFDVPVVSFQNISCYCLTKTYTITVTKE